MFSRTFECGCFHLSTCKFNQNYTYDNLSRVTARTVKKLSDNSVVSTETFNYDAAGNVTSAPDSSFQYDTNNRLISFNGNTVEYDLDGNMLSNGSLSCTYDSANILVFADGHTYTYNAEDVRIRNLCAEDDTTYTYNTNAKLSMLLMKTTGEVVTKYVYGKGLIGEEVNNTFKTYHFDCRGSTIAITDASGNITDTFAYDTYGKLISRTGTSKVIFGYNGRDGVVTDGNGLIYMRARYYSPEMKRFINADIIAGKLSNAITLNRFAYANGNPVSFVDPFGLWSLKEAQSSFSNWISKINIRDINPQNTARDIINKFKELITDTYNDSKQTIIDACRDVIDWKVNTFKEKMEVAKNVTSLIDTKVIKPVGKALTNAGRQIKDGFTTVANAIADNVGAKASAGKEKTLNSGYYFIATLEEGIGYSKDFGNEKPVTFFASAGENWWEFWEWSVGVDVNVNGYGAGISIGTETSINVHLGDVSHEVGVNALGRISHKIACNMGNGYAYSKYSLNGPEAALVAVGAYYAAPVVIPAIAELLSYIGNATLLPTG